MSAQLRTPWIGLSIAVIILGSVVLSGCATDSYAAKGAGKGAASGALAGAVGGMASALIFGGDVGEAAARGAVYGGATGAVAGGLSGAQVDKQVAAQKQAAQEAEIQKFRQEIGDDAFNGFVALTDCKHDIAIVNAREAAKNSKRDFALSGLWVEALTEADRNNMEAARAMLPAIVEKDRKLKTTEDAQGQLDWATGRLREVREEYGQPGTCR
jgi:hypothetical protein